MTNRDEWQPSMFGIEGMSRAEIVQVLVHYFTESLGRTWTVDELLLHPSDAARFCQDARFKAGWFDMPDDFVLYIVKTGVAASRGELHGSSVSH